MKITYLGHSAFIFEDDSFKAIIDPFISGNSLSNINVDEIKNLTHIFVTHGHGDHLGDTVDLAKSNDALIITNAEISNYLNEQGLKTHSMHIGGRHKFDFGTVTEDGPVDGGNPCGFVIEVNNKKIYHAGDTGLTMDMKLLELEHIDVAMLPIGGNFTMDIDDAVLATEFIKPELVIPMHYDTFPVIKADPKEFEENNKTCKTKIMKIGETYEL